MSVSSVFAKMIRGDIPVQSIYEDQYTFAVLDQNPLTEGHTLIVPKVEVDNLFDLPEPQYLHLWYVARWIASALKSVTACCRVGILVEGFAVPHAHIHLVPMHSDQDLKHGKRTQNVPQDVLEEVAQRIRTALSAEILEHKVPELIPQITCTR